jgi:excisionase family DNA binding protein
MNEKGPGHDPGAASTFARQPDGERRTPMRHPASDQPTDRLAYSVDEAAGLTGLSRDLLYDQMRAGKLAYLKVGRRRIITRQHLEAFLTRRAS